MNVTIRAEDIMTARNLLHYRASDFAAGNLANEMGFDAVPISRSDGRLLEFWSRPDRCRVRIARVYRTPHDAPIESLLAPLGKHIVRFVYYRSEVVGLIDASDLNKPLARIAWLHPMLELERSLLDAARALNISDDEQAKALGDHAAAARQRQVLARRKDLDLPLLDYAMFSHLLRAGRLLELVDLDAPAINELNDLRRRAAHSGDVVITDRTDCRRLGELLALAREAAQHVQARTRRRPKR